MSDFLYAGDSGDIFVDIDDSDGLPQPLGALTEATWELKRSEYDEDALLTKELDDGIVVTNPTTGGIRIRIDEGDTDDMFGPYVYFITCWVDGKKYTVLKDILILGKSA